MIKLLLMLATTGVMLLAACAPVGSEPGATIPAGDRDEPTTAAETPVVPETTPAEARPTADPTVFEVVPLEPVQPQTTPGTPATGEVPQEMLEAVLVDLQERTGASIEDVEVVKAESVVWNDGALGCHQPGMMYTQALEQGYHLVLAVDGQEYNYHLSERGSFVLCENGLRPKGQDGTVDR